MARLAVCIETFFADKPYDERIKAIAKLGFKAYEFWFHDKRFDGSSLHVEAKDFEAIAELNARYGLATADFVFNHPDGGVVASLIDSRDRGKLLDSFERIADLAAKVGCKALISGSGNKVPGLPREAALDSMVEGLRALAPLCAARGITLIVEPFNSRVNHPDYFLDDPTTCVDVLKKVGSPSVKMLYDIYHMQIMDGNVLSFVKENLPWIGHFHVAGVPGRNEPVPCELDYPFILKKIDEMGYKGYFGLEYWPIADSKKSLEATRRALAGR